MTVYCDDKLPLKRKKKHSSRKAAEESMTGASGHRRVPKEFYEEMMIPVPPIPVQKEIFAACEKIEAQYRSTRMSIKEYRQKIVSFLEEKEIMVTKIKETD